MKQRKYGENGHHDLGLTDQGTDAWGPGRAKDVRSKGRSIYIPTPHQYLLQSLDDHVEARAGLENWHEV